MQRWGCEQSTTLTSRPAADWQGNVTAQSAPSPLHPLWHGGASFAPGGGRTDHWGTIRGPVTDATGVGSGGATMKQSLKHGGGEPPLLSILYVDTTPWVRPWRRWRPR